MNSQPERLILHTIAKPEELSEHLLTAYSAMKYGEPSATLLWAKALTEKILNTPDLKKLQEEKGILWLSSSAYGSVPTAASSIAMAVAAGLSAKNWQVKLFKITREGEFERTNYGMLSKSEREEALVMRKISLDAAITLQLKGQTIVLIDDLICTGAHEQRMISLLTSQIDSVALTFAYCISLQGIDADGVEEMLNHYAIKQLADLQAMFAADKRPILNARLLKFILLQPPQQLTLFFNTIDIDYCKIIYSNALSSDAYYNKAAFREGFSVLEQVLFEAGVIEKKASYRLRNQSESKFVIWNLTESAETKIVCAETGKSVEEELALYSRFKFGDIAAIEAFGKLLAKHFIKALQNKDGFYKIFESAAANKETVYLIAPGVRNVVSASNFLMREFGLLVNSWLSENRLPTMIIRTLYRLQSGRANYAELNAMQRAQLPKKSKTLIPKSEFQEYPCHIIFLDDVEVSGQTSQRYRRETLAAGALSFHPVFLFQIDPILAEKDAGIEHRMNQFLVSGSLDELLVSILEHKDYQPVQRMLRLLLKPENRMDLPAFLQQIPDDILKRLYLGALSNDYLWILAGADDDFGTYAPSVKIIKKELQSRKLLDEDGLMI